MKAKATTQEAIIQQLTVEISEMTDSVTNLRTNPTIFTCPIMTAKPHHRHYQPHHLQPTPGERERPIADTGTQHAA